MKDTQMEVMEARIADLIDGGTPELAYQLDKGCNLGILPKWGAELGELDKSVREALARECAIFGVNPDYDFATGLDVDNHPYAADIHVLRACANPQYLTFLTTDSGLLSYTRLIMMHNFVFHSRLYIRNRFGGEGEWLQHFRGIGLPSSVSMEMFADTTRSLVLLLDAVIAVLEATPEIELKQARYEALWKLAAEE